jgi:leucine-rich repeat transmembrane neuronal protein 1/2
VNEKLNDNRWHEVRLLRSETYKQLIRVDDNTPTVDDLSGATAIHFDLEVQNTKFFAIICWFIF